MEFLIYLIIKTYCYLSLHQHSISPAIPSWSLLLRTLASPINPADINQIQGVYPSQPPFTNFLGTSESSAVGGNEGCFEIVRTGSAIKKEMGLNPGDWVVTKAPNFGTWRTHALATPNDVLRVEKKGLTPIQVATASINPITAYCMLREFEPLKEGDWWIQNGANSAVGRAAIQLGKLWGFKSINIIRESSDSTTTSALREELLALGATYVLTDTELFKVQQCRELIMNWTNGGREKIKLGLNCVGGKAASALAKCLSQGGHLVTYGNMSRQPLLLPAGQLIFENLRFSGFWVSRWAKENPEEKQIVLSEILNLICSGKLKCAPLQIHEWDRHTTEFNLKCAIKGTLEGFRTAKSIFLFKDTP